MGRTYYDCPCCERRVWVHSFWGAAWEGAVCHACRDDHGNYTTSSCCVDGPAKRRREQRARDAANERARQQAREFEIERQRQIERRQREERKAMEEMRIKRENERKAEAKRLEAARVAAKKEREEMQRKLAKEVADKKKAAEEIKKKTKSKKNPYKQFKNLETKKFIEDIGNKVIEYGAAAEELEGQIGDIKKSLKETLKGEFDIVKDEFVEYSKYVNGIKDLTGNFITNFESIFNEATGSKQSFDEDAEDFLDSDNDEKEKSKYEEKMKQNVDKLCNAVNNMMGEVAVIEAYYDYMLKDCEYFDEFVKEHGDQYEDEQTDLDRAIKALLKQANDQIKDKRAITDKELIDKYDINKTVFTEEYESKTYIRGCNSICGSMWNSIKDTTREGVSLTADAATFVTTGRYGLYGKCLKKIENEKRRVETKTATHEIEQFYFDGAKHKKVLETFTNEALAEIEAPLKKVVNKYKSVYGKSEKKTEEIKKFKENNFKALKQQLATFKTAADTLQKDLASDKPLRQSHCELFEEKWQTILYGDGDLKSSDNGIYGLISQMKKDKEAMENLEDTNE